MSNLVASRHRDAEHPPLPDVDALNARFAGAGAEEVLRWAIGAYGAELGVACSLQAEAVVILDMVASIDRTVRVFTIDTGRLHQETYDTIQRVRERYGMNIEVYFPDAKAVHDLMTREGPNSFYESVENRKRCCHVRKVEPMRRALENTRAWVAGLRRDQAETRKTVRRIEPDHNHAGLVKIHPLIDWTHDQVWEYIHAHDVPYNRLHDLGYPSIGCVPCTRRIQPGEDIRAGRWWWEGEEQKECGLHVAPKPDYGAGI